MEDFSADQKTLRSADGFTVVSEQRSHTNASTGGTTYYGEFHFKINGRTVDPDVLSAALFPKKSLCHDPFYRVTDVRLLQDNAALAIFSITNPACELGQIVIAKISAPNGKLRVDRIPVANDSGQIVNGTLLRRKGDTLTRTSNDHESRVAEQGDQGLPQTFLEVIPLGGRHQHSRMVRLDLGSLAQIELGQGQIMRFEGADAALMLDIPWQDERPVGNVRLVRLSDGLTLSNQILKIACLRPVGKEANHKAFWNLYNQEEDAQIRAKHEAIATGQEVVIPTRSGITNFDTDDLPPLALQASNRAVGDILRESLKASVVDGIVVLDLGSELRRVRKRCS